MGMIFSFVIPGILIGLLLGETMDRLKKMARAKRKRSALEEKKKLFIYDLRDDFPAKREEAAAA